MFLANIAAEALFDSTAEKCQCLEETRCQRPEVRGQCNQMNILLFHPKLQKEVHQAPNTTSHAFRPPSGALLEVDAKIGPELAFPYDSPIGGA